MEGLHFQLTLYGSGVVICKQNDDLRGLLLDFVLNKLQQDNSHVIYVTTGQREARKILERVYKQFQETDIMTFKDCEMSLKNKSRLTLLTQVPTVRGMSADMIVAENPTPQGIQNHIMPLMLTAKTQIYLGFRDTIPEVANALKTFYAGGVDKVLEVPSFLSAYFAACYAKEKANV
jgi:hypothetical protein